MSIYKTRSFARWMKREGLADRDLCDAVVEMQKGLIDARLGGGLIKKRVARSGHGKRGGYRVILASNLGDRWVFMFGFAKNERDNVDDEELRLMKRLASAFLEMDDRMLRQALTSGEILEIYHG
ncbi:MAG: type II toxin-antitoxin system RelE/ParE family toxin [Deltaproteobacteria bacterium]|nr:type II toxin-antitoxin system RelE/ParE family toxin [Deltaproteobacteria bacterium]MBI3063650.1 type II toxin-antitoxin system RelE/ParE family toxin [Deltaproteobacteria bacterium]